MVRYNLCPKRRTTNEMTSPTTERKWLAEGVRFTAFPAALSIVDASTAGKWWRVAVGEEPEEQTSKQRGHAIDLKGEVRGAATSLSVSPNKVEWRQSSQLQIEDERAQGIRSLGAFDVVIESFASIAKKWLELAVPLKRIAFGAVLMNPMPDIAASYKDLEDILSNRNLDLADGARDLVFRINRRRSAKLTSGGQILINRLQTWRCVTVSIVPFGIDSQGITGMPGEVALVATQVDLDINTAADRSEELGAADVVPLLDTLCSFGREIAEKGDIP